ncbi:hypothetical protein FHU41_001578 [Psychromicrobium silvestre]|uniref:Uncharacterized protein n=1 Tax=Psychromicrobium silvestre TaxID=1645614 RepID=A0A7Y9LTM4_9MICC|nr:hypothetical protein [Psychromicrobium silvestre]NYE95357.1 hypothetical protein [Psychromicrobium silvestre]
MKLELTFDPDSLTLGELRSFVARAEAAAVADTQAVQLDFDENDEVSGLSITID